MLKSDKEFERRKKLIWKFREESYNVLKYIIYHGTSTINLNFYYII